jgi:tetratricopeptide (TPR) repeat protein
VRFESGGDAVRLIVPFAGSWREYRLDDPPRLALDLDGVRSDLPHAPALYETRLDLGPIRYFRTSQIGEGPPDVRVRLTLEFSSEAKCEVRSAGGHLVVSVADPGRPARGVLELGPAGWCRPVSDEEVGAAPALDADADGLPPENRAAASTEDALAGLRHLRRAHDHLCGGETAHALAEYRRVAALPAGELQLRGMVRAADLYFQLGRADSAAVFYEQALRFGPPDEEASWAWFQLGNCLWLTGEREPAQERYRQLLERWPQSAWASIARACLEP